MKVLLCVLAFAIGVSAAESEWVHPGPDGKLVYKTTGQGDRIMDFSHAGCRAGDIKKCADSVVESALGPSFEKHWILK